MINTTDNNIFRLQKRFLYIEMLFFSAILSLCITSLFPLIFSFLAYEMIIISAFRAAIFLNSTAFIIYVLHRFIKTELRSFSIIFSDGEIIKKGFFKDISIPITDIKSIKYLRIPLLPGHLKIFTPYSTFLIPLSMDKPIEFVKTLRKALGESNNNLDSLSESSFIEDLNVYYDSYQRSLKAFQPLINISIFLFSVNIFVAVSFWELALIPVLLFAMSGFILPLIAYAIANCKINSSLRILLRSDTAEIHSANREYLYYGLLVFIFYLFFGILFKAVFLWHY